MGIDPLGIIVLQKFVMKKKYKCRLSASSLLVNVKGKVLRLEFEPDVVNEFGLRGCSYTIDNKDIQRCIEYSKRFNSIIMKDAIWTDDVEPKEEAPKKVAPKPAAKGKAKKEV